MVRVCPTCGKSFSGGQWCPECGPGQALIEASDPRARALLPARSWQGIRALYGARRAMLLAIGTSLGGVAASFLLFRRSVAMDDPADRRILIALGLLALIAVPIAGTLRGVRIARRNRRGYDLPIDDDADARFIEK